MSYASQRIWQLHLTPEQTSRSFEDSEEAIVQPASSAGAVPIGI